MPIQDENSNCIKSPLKTLTECQRVIGIDEQDGVPLFKGFQESSGARQINKQLQCTETSLL